MQEVYEFLKKCGVYYLTTVDGDKPRVRPMGTVVVYEGKLYVQTGKAKRMSKQMAQNANVELCAFDGKCWIRIQATVVEDDRMEPRQHMLEAFPSIQGMYAADDGNMQVFYLKDAKATFSSFTEAPRVVRF